MIRLTVTDKQSGQRLDRFLKKYFDGAPLSHIYRLIRRDTKVNGRRQAPDYMLATGDEIAVYVDEPTASSLQKSPPSGVDGRRVPRARRQFGIAYEDELLLIVEKPFGLLTHGDRHEKKNHLTNQGVDYLIETGAYDPRADRPFVPAPAGRLDRNTTGLVMFGKTGPAMQALNRLLREKSEAARADIGEPDTAGALTLTKRYLTIVAGTVRAPLRLRDRLTKDAARNRVTITAMDQTAEDADGQVTETLARPLATTSRGGLPCTLLMVEIPTGRTHQIRAQLAAAGYPLIGDAKYGDSRVNARMKEDFGLTTHLLHCWQLAFEGEGAADGLLSYMAGRTVQAPLPPQFRRIKDVLFGRDDSVLEMK